jgi:hypothetical protein
MGNGGGSIEESKLHSRPSCPAHLRVVGIPQRVHGAVGKSLSGTWSIIGRKVQQHELCHQSAHFY